MFNIQILPADHGDCLWIEYGTAGATNRILIDGGTQHSYEHLEAQIKNLPEDPLHFELFVITHVDADHIGGALNLLRNFENLGKRIVFDDVWFNAWKHLDDGLGDMQGELVTDHLQRRKLPWNVAFKKRAAVVPETGKLPSLTLDGGMRLTLLSPNREKLNKLRDRWVKTITDAGLVPGAVQDKPKFFEAPKDLLGDGNLEVEKLAMTPFKGDRTPANGSSIAFLAEFSENEKEKRCLFTGDAHVEVLKDSINRLIVDEPGKTKNGRLQIDALKVSHHGSKKNISKELLDLLDCPNFIFSTNGQQFDHPDPESVARVISFGRADNIRDPNIVFNYKSKVNKIWAAPGLQFKYDYTTEYPADGSDGLVVKL